MVDIIGILDRMSSNIVINKEKYVKLDDVKFLLGTLCLLDVRCHLDIETMIQNYKTVLANQSPMNTAEEQLKEDEK